MVSVLRQVKNSNAASRTIPVSFVRRLADDGDRKLQLSMEEVRRGSVPSVPSVSVSPLPMKPTHPKLKVVRSTLSCVFFVRALLCATVCCLRFSQEI